MTAYIADRGPREISVYTADDEPQLIATIRAVDLGSVDELLAAYGWRRLGPWATSDDTPPGHRLAAVVRTSAPYDPGPS